MAKLGNQYATILRPQGSVGSQKSTFVPDGTTIQFQVLKEGAFYATPQSPATLYYDGSYLTHDGEYRVYLLDFKSDNRVSDSAQLVGKTIELTAKEGKWQLGRFA